jgi:SAM-dependent methyltransferase
MTADTTSEAFFEQMYSKDRDPWSFATSESEQRRYSAIMLSLQGRRYRRAFEPGCSIGVLTAKLASICDEVEASDISATAVEMARRNCRNVPNVRIDKGSLPQVIPGGEFDLLVFSDIGYYFTAPDLRVVGLELLRRLSRPAVFLAVHWLGVSKDHLLSGDRVHEVLAELPGMKLAESSRHASFRLDKWSVE